jgi:hypothetical protein
MGHSGSFRALSTSLTFRPKQAQVTWDPPMYIQGGLRGTEPTTTPPRTSMPSSHEDSAGSKHREVSWGDQTPCASLTSPLSP